MIQDAVLQPLADELSKADAHVRTDALIRLAAAAREIGAWQHELSKADDEPLIEALETWVGTDKIRRAALDSVLADENAPLTKRAASMAGRMSDRASALFRMINASGKRTAKSALGAVGGAYGAVERGVSRLSNNVAGAGETAKRTVTGAKRVVDQLNGMSRRAGRNAGKAVGGAVHDAFIGGRIARDQAVKFRAATGAPRGDAKIFGERAAAGDRARFAAGAGKIGRMFGHYAPAAGTAAAVTGAAALTEAQLRQRRDAARSSAEKRSAMKADEAVELLKFADEEFLEELAELPEEEQLEVADYLRALAEDYLDLADALAEEEADAEKADAVTEDWLLRDGLAGLEMRKSALSIAGRIGDKATAMARLGGSKVKTVWGAVKGAAQGAAASATRANRGFMARAGGVGGRAADAVGRKAHSAVMGGRIARDQATKFRAGTGAPRSDAAIFGARKAGEASAAFGRKARKVGRAVGRYGVYGTAGAAGAGAGAYIASRRNRD